MKTRTSTKVKTKPKSRYKPKPNSKPIVQAKLKSVIDKPKLLIIANLGSRLGPSSPLIRLVRDYTSTLKKFEIHATGGTCRTIFTTGLFDKDEIVCHRSGPNGGVVELASIVASEKCAAVIFLADPRDLRSDVPENYALQRVCKGLGVRLVTTLAGAEEWLVCEARKYLTSWNRKARHTAPKVFCANWREGKSNIDKFGEPQNLPIEEQTLGLIAHDNKKDEMIQFVNTYIEFISRFHRILTTGTTGYLLKLLYASKAQRLKVEEEARNMLGEQRFDELLGRLWTIKIWNSTLDEWGHLMREARKKLSSIAYRELSRKWSERSELGRSKLVNSNSRLVAKIMPLPSGPKGGDILIANEVLKNRCHAVVFFQDPETAHPHAFDIRLFERTCQLWAQQPEMKQVYATCVSDPESAKEWLKNLQKFISKKGVSISSLASRLRQDKRYNLRDVVIVENDDDRDSEELGIKLARACAGYFHLKLEITARNKEEVRIGIGHGWSVKRVLEELKDMKKKELVKNPPRLHQKVIWSPIIGNMTAVLSDREAAVLADQYREHYGGDLVAFRSAGFVLEEKGLKLLPKEDKEIIAKLQEADLILLSTAPWDKESTLYKHKEDVSDRVIFPEAEDAVGIISGVFLEDNGDEVEKKHYMVGLGYDELRKVAKKGSVVMISGGKKRQKIAFAALRANLVSVLVTTQKTAEWLLKQK